MLQVNPPRPAEAACWAIAAAGLWFTLGSTLAACSSDSGNSPGVAGATSNAGAGALGGSSAQSGAGTGGTSSGGTPAISGAGANTAGAASSVAGSGGGGGAAGGQGGSSTGGTHAGGSAAGGGASAGASAAGGSAGASAHSGVWQVMPLGDSITGSTCYPQVLSQDFKTGGHTNFQFVGTQTANQSCGSGVPTVKMEGHPGYGVTYLVPNNTRSACTKSSGCGSYAELQTWAAEKPDIVLMHFGTNDVWDGEPTATILAAYQTVLSEFRKQNANVIFFVSKIIKLDPAGCTSCLTNVAALAAALTPAWAQTNATASSPVYIVDDYDSGYDPDSTTDSSDKVHPLLPGAIKMATATYNGVIIPAYF